MEDAFIVKGKAPLTGKVILSGAKNVALKVLIAALLFEDKVYFDNIPRLRDIEELEHVLDSVGVNISSKKKGLVCVDSSDFDKYEIDLLHASKTRVSFMLFAPFLHKFGKALIPNPGGCRIGARPIDRIMSMMDAFGIVTKYNHETGYYVAKVINSSLEGVRYRFEKKSHTGCELAIMFACRARGKSIIENAAQEPEIDDLINFLNISGAKIKRDGENILVEGVQYLTPPSSPYEIISDRIEAVTFASFALATKGDVIVESIDPSQLSTFLAYLRKTNAGFEKDKDKIRFYYKGRLKAVDIVTSPHPGFMTDWQAPWAVLMTQAQGLCKLHETVFENRFGYVKEICKLGAKIDFYTPNIKNPEEIYQFNTKNKDFRIKKQAIIIDGINHLHGGVMRVTDLRAGATLLIASCAAEGESVILGASIVDRGYERIEKKLQGIGANIKRV